MSGQGIKFKSEKLSNKITARGYVKAPKTLQESVKQNIITHYFTSLFQNNSKKTLNLKQNFPV